MTPKELYAKARLKAEEALVAAGEGRIEDYDRFFGEAETLNTQGDAAAKAVTLIDSLNGPASLPAPLPTDTSAAGAATIPQAPETPAQIDVLAEMNKAVYQIRYGSQESAIKAVLGDLHGPDYEAKRLKQYAYFVRYLRRYNEEPSGEAQQLLREVILTPEYALKAIQTGQDIKFIKATMVEAIDDLGGYVVPVDFQLEILRRIVGMTAMRGRARVMQTSRDRVDIPKMTGGDDQYTTAVRVTWVSETPTAGTAATNLTFGLENIPINDVMAETFFSRNVVEDSAFDIVAELTAAFAEAAAIDEDNQFITGDGDGKPDGILISGTTPATGVTAVNSLAATELTADGMINLEYEIPSQYRSNCIWITNRRAVRDLRKLKGGDGHYLWGAAELAGQPATFDSYPIVEQEIMPAVAASAYPVLYGDPAGYRIVDRIGMTVERYLDASTARINQILYLMRRRIGGKLTHPERWAAQLISL